MGSPAPHSQWRMVGEPLICVWCGFRRCFELLVAHEDEVRATSTMKIMIFFVFSHVGELPWRSIDESKDNVDYPTLGQSWLAFAHDIDELWEGCRCGALLFSKCGVFLFPGFVFARLSLTDLAPPEYLWDLCSLHCLNGVGIIDWLILFGAILSRTMIFSYRSRRWILIYIDDSSAVASTCFWISTRLLQYDDGQEPITSSIDIVSSKDTEKDNTAFFKN